MPSLFDSNQGTINDAIVVVGSGRGGGINQCHQEHQIGHQRNKEDYVFGRQFRRRLVSLAVGARHFHVVVVVVWGFGGSMSRVHSSVSGRVIDEKKRVQCQTP